jgi:hypothetical protein
MNIHYHRDLSPGEEEQRAAPPVSPLPSLPEMLLRLQRGSGNHAVSRMILQRQEAASAAGGEPDEDFDDEEDEEEAPLGPEDMLEGPVVEVRARRRPAVSGTPPRQRSACRSRHRRAER